MKRFFVKNGTFLIGITLSCLFLALVLGLMKPSFWLPSAKQHGKVTTLGSPSSSSSSSLSSPAFKTNPFIPFLHVLATVSTREQFSFDSPGDVEKTKNELIEISSFLSPSKKRASFLASHLNTKDNAQAAQRIIEEDYPPIIGDEAAKKRVVALQLLSYTDFLSKEKCHQMMDSLARQYNKARPLRHKIAVQLDTGAVAGACSRVKGFTVNSSIKNIENLDAQAKIAISSSQKLRQTEDL